MNSTNSSSHTKGAKPFPVQKVILEVFSIVLAVLLALGVNEWRERRADRIQADTALENVATEVSANLVYLMSVHENNKKTLASIESGIANDTVANGSISPGLQVSGTAWQTLLATGVSNTLDYSLVLTLSKTYSIQDIYIETGKSVTDAALSIAAYSTVLDSDINQMRFQEQFESYFRILVLIEAELIKAYELVGTDIQKARS